MVVVSLWQWQSSAFRKHDAQSKRGGWMDGEECSFFCSNTSRLLIKYIRCWFFECCAAAAGSSVLSVQCRVSYVLCVYIYFSNNMLV